MSAPHFHGSRPSFSATLALEALGESLAEIRKTDKLTWEDVGQVLGKSDDRAAAYSTGLGDMGLVSFLLGCREWNGRFANDVLALIGTKLVPLNSGGEVGQETITKLTRLVADLSAALENGGLDDAKLATMAGVVDEAGRAIDAMRERLGSQAVRR